MAWIHIHLLPKTKTASLPKKAAWEDVKAKGRRLLSENRYRVITQSTYSILAEVRGDNDTYLAYVNNQVRVNKYENNEMAYWDCTCPWSEWAWTRETYTGRICSHVYAMHLLLQRNRRKGSVMDDSRLELARNAITEAASQDLEAFIEYVKNDIAVELVTDTLVNIAVDFQLPVDMLDNITYESVMSILNSQAASIEDELVQVLSDGQQRLDRFEMEAELITQERVEKEKEQYLNELMTTLLENTSEEALDELIDDPSPFLANLGVQLEDEDLLSLKGALIQAIMPAHVASVDEIQSIINELRGVFSLEEIREYALGAPNVELESELKLYDISREDFAKAFKETKLAGFKKRAGRFFTEEEKLALINEMGIARQYLAGEIKL